MRNHVAVRTLATVLCALTPFTALAAAPAASPGATADWAYHGGDTNESGYSRLDQIRASNIGRLGLAWSLDLPGESSLEATPLAVNGVLYFTGSYAAVYAVDGRSGRLLWKYDSQTWKYKPYIMPIGLAVNRGVAYADGRVFSATKDGRLLALDAGSGKLLWSVDTIEPGATSATISGAPRTFNGKVIIGNGGSDLPPMSRGYVTAYDAVSGRQVWRFHTVPGSPAQNQGDPAMERAAATWHGEYWKTGTGGSVWDSITFDAEVNRIYIGTANAGPYVPEVRSPGGGDNLYTASIVALDADTGRYVWHYQVNPRDAWDFDSTQRMTLADLTIDGARRKVLMQAPKNGFMYVLDRRTGKLISAGKIGKATWAERIDVATGRPVEAKNVHFETNDLVVWPSPAGAHSWQDMSFSPRTGLVYIPYMQLGAHHSSTGEPGPGAMSVGGVNTSWVVADAEDGKGALLAWDPIAQRARWKQQHGTLWNGGTLATAGDLVFQGTADGFLYAYQAATGQPLWKFNAGLGIIAAPISFATGGKQYISVLVGYGGLAAVGGKIMDEGWKYGAQPRRLLTFALDGKTALPATAPPSKMVNAVDDPSIQIRADDAKAGRLLFDACAVCHGRGLVSTGAPAPDLRESRLALNADAFWSVVHDGALLANGMPRYDHFFTREQIMQIYAYIRAGAREVIAENARERSSHAPPKEP